MTLLQMTFMAAALITITIILRALLLNKLPKQGFMALWYISLARLLIPFSIPSAASVYTVAQNIAQTGGASTATIMDEQIGMTIAGGFPPQIQNYALSGMPESMVMTPIAYSLPTEIIVWLVGMVALALFFIITHLRWLKEYKAALPVENDFVDYWQAAHPLRRRVEVRCAESIAAPLTYGIFRPVVLLPKATDYNDLEKLSYILSHEYAHIRRFDALVKPLLAIALCMHWFNPLVWVMYILANRDMELCCDESAVREYGIEGRGSYALTLIGMEEAKGADPLCNCFKRSAAKERITSIMKIKKISVAAVVVATILIMSVTVAFATSTKEKTPDTQSVVDNQPIVDSSSNSIFTSLSKDEGQIMRSLMPEGYEKMSVTEYRNKILPIAEGAEGKALIEKISDINGMRIGTDESSYIDYALMPLIADDWENVEFSCGFSSYKNISVTFTTQQIITNANKLTVGEYSKTVENVFDAVNKIIETETTAKIEDMPYMEAIMESEMERLEKEFSNDFLTVKLSDVSYKYPMNYGFDEPEDVSSGAAEMTAYEDEAKVAIEEDLKRNINETEALLQSYLGFGLTYDEQAMKRGEVKMFYHNKEVRSLYDNVEQVFIANSMNPDNYSADAIDLVAVYSGSQVKGLREATADEIPDTSDRFPGYDKENYTTQGSRIDYASLLALKTTSPDYRFKSVEDFDAELLDWANADYDRHDRILEDISAESLPENLSDAEKLFVTRTFAISNYENAKMIESEKPGGKNYDIFTANTLDKEYRDTQNDMALAWCTLYYEFGYDVPDKAKLTVGDRDSRISEFAKDIQRFWDETDIDTLLKMSEEDIKKEITRCAEQNTTPEITINPELSTVFFEKKDERGLISDKTN